MADDIRDGRRQSRGRLKKSWREVVRDDLVVLCVTKDLTIDKNLW